MALSMYKCTSAPGPDGIPYSIYKQLPDEAIDLIVKMFNAWFESGDMPTECDLGLQVAIPKGVPGKFRSITLKNAFSKIFERVLYGRIHHWIDSRLPDYQFGFRRKLGCREQLIRLINHLQVECEQKRVSVVSSFSRYQKGIR